MTKRTTESEPVLMSPPEWRDRSRSDRFVIPVIPVIPVSPFSLYR